MIHLILHILRHTLKDFRDFHVRLLHCGVSLCVCKFRFACTALHIITSDGHTITMECE